MELRKRTFTGFKLPPSIIADHISEDLGQDPDTTDSVRTWRYSKVFGLYRCTVTLDSDEAKVTFEVEAGKELKYFLYVLTATFPLLFLIDRPQYLLILPTAYAVAIIGTLAPGLERFNLRNQTSTETSTNTPYSILPVTLFVVSVWHFLGFYILGIARHILVIVLLLVLATVYYLSDSFPGISFDLRMASLSIPLLALAGEFLTLFLVFVYSTIGRIDSLQKQQQAIIVFAAISLIIINRGRRA